MGFRSLLWCVLMIREGALCRHTRIAKIMRYFNYMTLFWLSSNKKAELISWMKSGKRMTWNIEDKTHSRFGEGLGELCWLYICQLPEMSDRDFTIRKPINERRNFKPIEGGIKELTAKCTEKQLCLAKKRYIEAERIIRELFLKPVRWSWGISGKRLCLIYSNRRVPAAIGQ